MSEIRNSLKKEFDSSKFVSSKVLSVKDCIISISYTLNVGIYHKVFYKGVYIGYINSINMISMDVYLIQDMPINTHDEILISFDKLSVDIDENLFGNVINPVGDLILSMNDAKNYNNSISLPIYKEPTPITKRNFLSNQFITGYNVVDFMYPVGYGQRMLLVGDNGTYKTTFVKSVMKNYASNSSSVKTVDTKFIFVSVGKKSRDLSQLIDYVIDYGLIKNTIIIHSGANDPMGMQILSPDAAMSIAEFLSSKYSYNVCVIIDDITKHIMSYREIKLLGNSLPGREAYPSESFYVHARMLERAGNFKDSGSITCFAVVETNNEDITSYIVTNLVSITDGQIFNSSSFMRKLIIPPVSTQLSISRTGSSVQSKYFKKIYNKCRLLLKNFDDVEDIYSMYRENSDKSVLDKIKRGLFVKSVIYGVHESTISFVGQIICSTIIDQDIFYNDFSISDIESNKLVDRVLCVISDIEYEFGSEDTVLDITNYNENVYQDIVNKVREYESTIS